MANTVQQALSEFSEDDLTPKLVRTVFKVVPYSPELSHYASIDDAVRARKLTSRGRSYGQRALCAAEKTACGIWDLNYAEFVRKLDDIGEKHVEPLYTFGLSWIAYIQAHSDDWDALAKLPQAKATLIRVQELSRLYKQADIEHV